MWINTLWYILFVIIISVYLILDGFDLGVGILHLFIARNDNERRVLFNSIGPIWDGNEVWLVIGGTVFFAAFPFAYASLFSGFYVALMLVLLVLILRTVAMEFRSKKPNPSWRSLWDIVFCISSIGIALLLGVAFGNIIRGVPLDGEGNMAVSLFSLLNPYSLLVGVTAIFMFAIHGVIYLVIKTEADLQKRTKDLVSKLIIIYAVLIIVVMAATLLIQDTIRLSYLAKPWLVILPILWLVAVIATWLWFKGGRYFQAFIASSVTILSLLLATAAGLYPNLLVSNLDSTFNLTVTNAASETNTLTIMLVIALIGLPFILLYSIGVHYFFRGKVKVDSSGY